MIYFEKRIILTLYSLLRDVSASVIIYLLLLHLSYFKYLNINKYIINILFEAYDNIYDYYYRLFNYQFFI